jgi:zinc protease
MMFQGSENVGKGEHFIQVLNNGGGMNGTTNEDRTTYFEELPKNQLDLGLFLEADRMRALNINQANLDNQRNAVQSPAISRVPKKPDSPFDPCAMMSMIFPIWTNAKHENFSKP